ncbi:hypothetical protein TVAGG3_0540240 [Trichomonas vaginalis G3]|uniref:hypothetical protein n=1 Tax=Trichomonas vaginalis (strain ATCC PRA-98 / G3) TaxID=412133 RepID=UPI0021E5EE5A|nr:hypothetical protein TVAGG3_0540240 [Trichomonas vaginalis G3]KAI5519786.1 hypothetical protein TVAGG3_0540240 [Trichomonas vaginalis G3]
MYLKRRKNSLTTNRPSSQTEQKQEFAFNKPFYTPQFNANAPGNDKPSFSFQSSFGKEQQEQKPFGGFGSSSNYSYGNSGFRSNSNFGSNSGFNSGFGSNSTFGSNSGFSSGFGSNPNFGGNTGFSGYGSSSYSFGGNQQQNPSKPAQQKDEQKQDSPQTSNKDLDDIGDELGLY